MAKQGKGKTGRGKNVATDQDHAKSVAPASTASSSKPPAKNRILAASAGTGWKWPLALALGVAIVASFSIWLKASRPDAVPGDILAGTAVAAPPDFPDNTGPEAGYVGSASCAECHQSITESYNHIAMGRSLYAPTPDNIIEDYETNNEFFHEPSSIYYRMTHENGKFFQESFQKDPQGKVINQNKVQVTYVVGSGNNSRSYVHREPDGKVYQLPVAWYSEDKKWAMNPGYDNADHINFSRRITYDCMFCHAAYPDLGAGEDQTNFGESSFFPEHLEAIDCERCHGPAQEHVKLAKSGAAADAIKNSIINTANLSNELQLEVCMQCHLETTSGKLPHSVHTLDKGIFGYRPGEPLEDYRYAFNHPPGTGHDDKFEIAGQAYRMRMSPCFIKSEGKMTCTTCHDPHRIPEDKVFAAIQSCLECHAPADCTEKIELRMPVKDNCIQCHMPQRRTDDVINVVMTDHFIQRRPPPAHELLAPKKEHGGDYRGDIVAYYPEVISEDKRDLYMGLAYVSNSADLKKGLGFLDAALAGSKDRPFPAVYTRGVALKMLGDMESAREGLEESVRLRPDHPQAWMALADLHEQMKNYKRSIECYQMANRLDPRLSRAQNGLGTSLMLSGDQAGAAKAFRAAITLDPFDDNPHLNLSGIYLQKGDFDPAAAEARAALAINPNRSAGWSHLAQCALGQNKPAEALWPILEAIRLNGADMQYGEILLSTCKALGPHQTLTALDKLNSFKTFASQVVRSQALIQMGDTTGASAALDSAAQQTSSTTVMATAVQSALNAQRPDLALTWAAHLASAQKGNDEASVALANALRANSNHAQAATVLEDTLLAGRSPRVLNALAWLRATAPDDVLRNGAQAEQLYSEALAAMGQPNVFLLQTRAAISAETGKIDQAIATAEQALNMAQNARLDTEVRRIQAQLTDYQNGKPHRSQW